MLEAVGFNASTAIGTKIHISVDRIPRPVKFWFSLFIEVAHASISVCSAAISAIAKDSFLDASAEAPRSL